MSWRSLAVSLSPPSSLAHWLLSSKTTASAARIVTTQRREEVGSQGHPAELPRSELVTWPPFRHRTWQEQASSRGGQVSRGRQTLGHLLRLAVALLTERSGLLAGKGGRSASNTPATVGRGAASAIFTNVTVGQRPVITDPGWALQLGFRSPLCAPLVDYGATRWCRGGAKERRALRSGYSPTRAKCCNILTTRVADRGAWLQNPIKPIESSASSPIFSGIL